MYEYKDIYLNNIVLFISIYFYSNCYQFPFDIGFQVSYHLYPALNKSLKQKRDAAAYLYQE